MDCGALGGLLRSSEIFELPFWVILGYSRAFRVRVGVKKYKMDSLKYTNIEQYYIYYDLTNKPTSRPIRLFVYHLIGLLLVGLSGSKQTMFMNMFVYRTPWSCQVREEPQRASKSQRIPQAPSLSILGRSKPDPDSTITASKQE
jgi:hypothetical protein